VLGALALDAVFLGSLFVWLRNVHPGSLRAIGVRWRLRVAAAGAGLGIVLYGVAAGALAFGLQWLYERMSGTPVEAPDQMPGGLTTAGTVAFVVLAVAVAPVVEEVYFRGILYRSLRDRYGLVAGLVGSSLLFGLVHYQRGSLADALFLQTVMVITGVGFALIYERAGNLVASIAAHAAFNAIGVTLILRAAVS
jgi:membrane protease YdiL (CAAX protease family)